MIDLILIVKNKGGTILKSDVIDWKQLRSSKAMRLRKWELYSDRKTTEHVAHLVSRSAFFEAFYFCHATVVHADTYASVEGWETFSCFDGKASHEAIPRSPNRFLLRCRSLAPKLYSTSVFMQRQESYAAQYIRCHCFIGLNLLKSLS